MGVTIHYRGRLREPNLIEPLVQELQDICEINNWDYTLLPEDFSERIAGFNIRGIMFNVHEDCEPIVFVFNEHGYTRSMFDLIFERRLEDKTYSWISTKTQFAGADTHIKIINLLLHLRKTYFKRMDIRDEGGFYPSKDEEKLRKRFDVIQNTIDTISDVMEHSDFKSNTPDEFVEEVRNAISKSLGNVEIRVVKIDPENLSDSLREMGELISRFEQDKLLNKIEEDDDELLDEGTWEDLDDDED